MIVGRSITSPSLQIHTDNYIILWTSKPNRNIYTNLIPDDFKNKLILMLSENLKKKILQNLKDIKIINYFNSLSKKSVEINKLKRTQKIL